MCVLLQHAFKIVLFMSGFRHLMPKTPNVGQTIYNTIVDLVHTNRSASRATVAEVTGYKLTIVDDHIKRMKDDGRLRLVVPGVYEPVEPPHEDRAVSMTILPNGWCKLEVGDVVLEMSMREARFVGAATAGINMQFATVGAS